MPLLPALFLLATLGPPDWLPPAPEVLFTQVDRNGNELSDSFPALCGWGVCRGSLPVAFSTGRCLVAGWVRFPEMRHAAGTVLFSAGLCTPSTSLRSGQTGGVDGFWLDRFGAASQIVRIDGDGGPLRDLFRRPDDVAYIRVDIVAATHAH